jgi:hypothetical protein
LLLEELLVLEVLVPLLLLDPLLVLERVLLPELLEELLLELPELELPLLAGRTVLLEPLEEELLGRSPEVVVPGRVVVPLVLELLLLGRTVAPLLPLVFAFVLGVVEELRELMLPAVLEP